MPLRPQKFPGSPFFCFLLLSHPNAAMIPPPSLALSMVLDCVGTPYARLFLSTFSLCRPRSGGWNRTTGRISPSGPFCPHTPCFLPLFQVSSPVAFPFSSAFLVFNTSRGPQFVCPSVFLALLVQKTISHFFSVLSFLFAYVALT